PWAGGPAGARQGHLAVSTSAASTTTAMATRARQAVRGWGPYPTGTPPQSSSAAAPASSFGRLEDAGERSCQCRRHSCSLRLFPPSGVKLRAVRQRSFRLVPSVQADGAENVPAEDAAVMVGATRRRIALHAGMLRLAVVGALVLTAALALLWLVGRTLDRDPTAAARSHVR